jgi:hypothetical protein
MAFGAGCVLELGGGSGAGGGAGLLARLALADGSGCIANRQCLLQKNSPPAANSSLRIAVPVVCRRLALAPHLTCLLPRVLTDLMVKLARSCLRSEASAPSATLHMFTPDVHPIYFGQ